MSEIDEKANSANLNKAKLDSRPVIEELKKLFKVSSSDQKAVLSKPRPKTAEAESISK